MTRLAVVWVPQNDDVALAIIGASRPEQVVDDVGASGVTRDADVLERVDDALGELVERDPGRTVSPPGGPADPIRQRSAKVRSWETVTNR